MNEFEPADEESERVTQVTESPEQLAVRPRQNMKPILMGAAIGLAVYLGFRIPYELYQWSYPGLQSSMPSLADFLGPEPWLGRVLSSLVNLFSLSAFFVAMLMLKDRRAEIRKQDTAFSFDLLDDDDDAILLPDDALRLRNRIRRLSPEQQSLTLIRLLWSGLQRARANWSADDAAAAVKNQAEIAAGESESGYAILKYLVWAIPSIGFIGTVMGISSALYAFGEGYSKPAVISVSGTAASEDVADAEDASRVSAESVDSMPATGDSSNRVESLQKKTATEDAIRLATAHLHKAFDTTFVALILSVIAMFFLHSVQGADDAFLVTSMDWCMQRFVLRMHTPKGDV